MKKVLLALIMVVGCLFASEGQKSVTTCRFEARQIGAFADSPMTCSGDFKKSSTTQELYGDGWRLINSYTQNSNVYLVFEKNKSL